LPFLLLAGVGIGFDAVDGDRVDDQRPLLTPVAMDAKFLRLEEGPQDGGGIAVGHGLGLGLGL
jgi:hypothetical protein